MDIKHYTSKQNLKQTCVRFRFYLAERMGFAPQNYILLSRLGSKRWVTTFCRRLLQKLVRYKSSIPTRSNPILINKKQNLKQTSVRFRFYLAERMGFEPMCRELDNRISSAARYDHFDIFPYCLVFCKLYFNEMR